MSRSFDKYLRLLFAFSTLFAPVMSSGVHLHLLLEHSHDHESADQLDVMIHAHEDFLGPISTSVPASESEHRHLVLSTQIIALHPSSIQITSLSLVELDQIVLPGSMSSFVTESSGSFISTDGSPPGSDPPIEVLSGRAPPPATTPHA